MRNQFRRAQRVFPDRPGNENLWLIDWVRDRHRGWFSLARLPDGETPASTVDLTDPSQCELLVTFRRSRPDADGVPHGWIVGWISPTMRYTGERPYVADEAGARKLLSDLAGGAPGGRVMHGTRVARPNDV